MPLGDVTYINAALDGVIGSFPASGGTYQLYSDDPQLADDLADVRLDLDAAGLTAPAFDPGDWTATDGATTPGSVALGTSTDALTGTGAYWGIEDTDGLLVYSDDLDEDDIVAVDEAGSVAAFTPTITFGDGA